VHLWSGKQDEAMIRLSVNINKIATLRNARGGNVPDVLKASVDLQNYGAQGITVHPRPDERHIRYADVRGLRPLVHTEFNVEGYPSEDFLQLVEEVKPEQVTLVPDPPGAITSNAGWKTREHGLFLRDVTSRLQAGGMRVSIFLDPKVELVETAAGTGADRIELYTEPYAKGYVQNKAHAIAAYAATAQEAMQCGMGVNAGHDLSLENLRYFAASVPGLLEVSIGHALISDALYYGLENTVQMYLHALQL
jgi:pyridoxine 5-phosphate synthase